MSDDRDAELLSASLDGALDAEEARRVEAWLESSPEARAERDGLRAVKAALGALPDVEPPAGFYEAMLERGSPRPDAAVVPLGRRRLLPATAAAIAAAAAAVVVVGSSAATVTPPVERVEAALAGPVDGDLDVDVVDDDGSRFALLGQDGEVAWDELPDGTRGRDGGAATWVDLTADPGVARVVVERDGRVYTLASEDIDAEALVEVGLELPGDDSLVGRFRRACEALLGAFSGD